MAKLTKEQREEFLKCATDFPYFCKTYIKINGNDAYQLYPYQERLYNHLEDHRQTIFSKFRIAGFTTELTMYSLWRCLFREDQRICYVSHSPASLSATSLFKNVAQNLPEWMSDDIKLINEHKKTFPETNSSIIFTDIKDASMQNSVNLMIIDEASFVPGMESYWLSMSPKLLASGCRTVVFSSVNKPTDWFWKTLMDSIRGKNNFSYYECDIDEHPDFCCKTWQDSMKMMMGKRSWRAEYEQEPFSIEAKKESSEVAIREIRSIYDEWNESKTE